jgi:acyl-coenzyme A thioesterase PaaI-like protein
VNLAKLKEKYLLKLINMYPPYIGAGVSVRPLNPEETTLEVSMKLRPWNQNYVGTHFGGSLYSMCDPWFMLVLIKQLGREYLVWDKAASIRFVRPGKGRVKAVFEISKEKVEEIKAAVENDGKVEPEFHVDVKNEDGEVVARVHKTLWVKKKT